MSRSGNNAPLERAMDVWRNETVSHTLPENMVLDLETHKRILSIFNVGDYYYYVFNLRTGEFEFVSDQVEKILGIKPEEISVPKFFELLHPEDVESFVKIEEKVAQFFAGLSPDDIVRYKARYDLRLRAADGNYKRILSQIVVFESDAQQNSLKSFCVHTDVTHLKDSNSQGLSFIGIDGLPSFLDVEFEALSKPAVFSARQLEVLQLLVSGANRVRIAEELHISKHTVDTHRRTIFKIADVHSVHELLKKSVAEGWI